MIRHHTIIFDGDGLDQKTPRHKMPEGSLIACNNVERKIEAGYRRILGYAAFDSNAIDGQGAMRGTWKLGTKVYAFRDATGGATTDMWWSTGSGWTKVTMPQQLEFDAGTTEIVIGETVTGAGGANGVVTNIYVSSGTWAGNDAAGVMYFDSVASGPFVDNEALTGSASGAATADGANAAYSITGGGRYEFVNYDFAGTVKMYGCDGANKAFEYDGTSFIPIHTGMTTDTPSHIIAHRNHLFLSFGRSVQFSSLGLPLTWSPVSGANELLADDTVTGFMQLPGGVLGIWSRNRFLKLYGSDTATWIADELIEHGNKIGAIEWSLQQLGARIRFVDDRGLVDLRAAEEYGDFADATISYLIQKYLDDNKENIVSSCIVKEKSQYRVFFNDGKGAIFTFRGNTLAGATPCEFSDVVRCVVNAEDANGSEVIYFGSDDGIIYQMESGNAFGDQNIFAYLQHNFTDCGMPRQRKRFKRVALDLKTPAGNVTLSYKPFFEFDSQQQETSTIEVTGGQSLLGIAILGRAILGGQQVQEGVGDIHGKGSEISMLLFTDSSTTGQWEVDSLILDYTTGGKRRQ